jgi:hypothetical protein
VRMEARSLVSLSPAKRAPLNLIEGISPRGAGRIPGARISKQISAKTLKKPRAIIKVKVNNIFRLTAFSWKA